MTETGSLRVERVQTTLRERTLETLRRAILEQLFKPGDRLVERDLCDQLAVSRTVVREVLRHLEAEGIVENVPNKGPAVAEPTLSDIRQIYELRGQLEAMAAKACAEVVSPEIVDALNAALAAIRTAYATKRALAVLDATTEFYRILFAKADRPIAWGIVSSLNARINYLRALTISTTGRDIEGPAQMQTIVDAIGSGNAAAASQACLTHVSRALDIAQARLTAAHDAHDPARKPEAGLAAGAGRRRVARG